VKLRFGRRGVPALALVLAALAGGCGPFADDDVDGSLDELDDAVRRASETGRPFRLSAVTSFAWDRFHVFPPNSTPTRINRTLGFEWGRADHSNVGSDDSINLLVFVRGGEVVRAFDHDRGRGDLVCLSGRALGRPAVTRPDAVLRVSRARAGRRREQRRLVVLAKPRSRSEARSIARCVRNLA
jgi:hypothetical protein